MLAQPRPSNVANGNSSGDRPAPVVNNIQRPRRLRRTPGLRQMVQETVLTVND